jgi:putative transcriptional regulator
MIRPKLLEVLTAKNRSIYWLCKETGTAYSTLHRLARGRANSIEFRILDKVCEALHCQPGDILIRSANGHKPTAKGAGQAARMRKKFSKKPAKKPAKKGGTK